MEHARILNKILPKLYVVKFKKKLKMFIFNKLLKLIKEKKMKKQNFLVLSIFIITILLSGCIEDEDSTTTENDYFISITPEEQNVKICEEAAQQYYETHTYVGNDVFDCDNMAIDVWNILKTKGINAEIAVGNVDLDEYDIDVLFLFNSIMKLNEEFDLLIDGDQIEILEELTELIIVGSIALLTYIWYRLLNPKEESDLDEK